MTEQASMKLTLQRVIAEVERLGEYMNNGSVYGAELEVIARSAWWEYGIGSDKLIQLLQTLEKNDYLEHIKLADKSKTHHVFKLKPRGHEAYRNYALYAMDDMLPF